MTSKLDYLQKYLSGGESIKAEGGKEIKAKKKKKKKDKKGQLRIIDHGDFGEQHDDDDDDVKIEEDDELSYATLEDRPQIAGFVDERPEIVIMKERRFTTATFKVTKTFLFKTPQGHSLL